jgi:hypothetical protein
MPSEPGSSGGRAVACSVQQRPRWVDKVTALTCLFGLGWAAYVVDRDFFDTGASAERGFLAGGSASSEVLRREAFRYARNVLARTDRRRWIPYAAAYELVKFAGVQLGARHRRLPLWLKRRCSFFPAYWEDQARRERTLTNAG